MEEAKFRLGPPENSELPNFIKEAITQENVQNFNSLEVVDVKESNHL